MAQGNSKETRRKQRCVSHCQAAERAAFEAFDQAQVWFPAPGACPGLELRAIEGLAAELPLADAGYTRQTAREHFHVILGASDQQEPLVIVQGPSQQAPFVYVLRMRHGWVACTFEPRRQEKQLRLMLAQAASGGATLIAC